MTSIFKHASKVFLWLGTGDGTTEAAVSVINSIARRLYAPFEQAGPLDDWLAVVPRLKDKYKIVSNGPPIDESSFLHKEWQAFWRFYQAEWFFRVWVIDEARRPRHVLALCGTSSIPWNMVGLVAAWARRWGDRPWQGSGSPELARFHQGVANATLIWDQRFRTRSHTPLLELLERARRFQASDPRDKVFAMLRHGLDTTEPLGQDPVCVTADRTVETATMAVSRTNSYGAVEFSVEVKSP